MAITSYSKDVQLIETPKAEAIFTQKERNNVMRSAMVRVASYWVEEFLPLRFTEYAVKLGYNPAAKWEDYKMLMADSQKKTRKTYRRVMRPQPTPMVFTGDMRKAALGRNSIKATATRGNGTATIRMPFGHAVQPRISDLFRRLPVNEKAALQIAFKAAYAASLERGMVRANIRLQKVAAIRTARMDKRQAKAVDRALKRLRGRSRSRKSVKA